ncbi:MAG TPA: alpha-amylase family glycosyl hydrolase, partial [Kofleriaceae bacterium]|nr:alpha-amylase family glycosyl hydrolase [Kofleriaceae bacterium]
MRILAPLLLLLQIACSPPGSAAAGDDAAAVPADAARPAADAAVVPPVETDWRARPIYMVLTDRFANGDASNDDLGVPGCFDPQAERSFHGGDLAGLRQRADYLAELGVGTLWITPLYEQVGCGYHGYWADYRVPDPRLVEPRLGGDADVDALIEALHARGIGLMLDMIVNHAGRGATIVDQHPDWFHSSSNCAELGPPEIYCPLAGLPDFAHENEEVATFVTDISAAWLRRFEVDGVRMDTAKHVTREYFRDHWFPRMRAERPGLVVIAEVFDASGAGVYQEYFEAGFDSAFHFALRQGLIDVFGRDASTNVLADRVRDSVDTLGL